jgi:flagellar hook protein FlgE
MADPVTGTVQYSTSASDIAITDAHNIMQAKATSSIKYAGILDSGSTGSEHVFEAMLTQASETMKLTDVFPAGGSSVGLGLASSETITVSAHATALTSMDQVYTEGGQSLGLNPGTSSVVFDVGGARFHLDYDTTNSVGGGVYKFTDMQGFVAAINTMMADNTSTFGTATASIENGQILINNSNSGSTSFKIESISCGDSMYLTNLMSGLQGTYSSGSQGKNSSAFFFQKNLKLNEDFVTMGDLASQIESAISGNVVTKFEAEFLSNNFGLVDGETLNLTFDIATGGAAASTVFNFTYKESTTPPLGPNEFHTLSDLASRLTTQLNTALGGSYVSVVVNGEGLDFRFSNMAPSGYSLSLTDTVTNTVLATPGASPYLEGVFGAIKDITLTNTYTGMLIQEISGKGRFSYNNTGTVNTDPALTNFSIRKASSGGTFEDNILINQNSSIIAGGTSSSQKFLTTAIGTTKLLDLFTNVGEPCGFVEDGTILNFNATMDGVALTNANNFSVTVNSTVQDMMDALEEYLGLGKSFNQKRNVVLQNGVMTVYGENGEANNIDSLSISGYPDSKMTAFNGNIGTPNNIVSASGGRFVSDMTLYDQQGNEHVVKFDFSAHNSEKNEWRLRISTDDINAKVNIDGASTNEIIIAFNPDGTPSHIYDPYTTPNTLLANTSISFDPGNGTNKISGISLFLGSPGKNDGLTLSRANSSINTAEQDGYSLGVLEQKYFNEEGELIGFYTNGQVRTIAQIATALFQNERGLLKVGNTMFKETANSGSAAIGTPLSGSRGQIAANSLEQSNVDLSTEFVSMIVTERGFQANSRVVTTSDEMIQELLNLKR